MFKIFFLFFLFFNFCNYKNSDCIKPKVDNRLMCNKALNNDFFITDLSETPYNSTNFDVNVTLLKDSEITNLYIYKSGLLSVRDVEFSNSKDFNLQIEMLNMEAFYKADCSFFDGTQYTLKMFFLNTEYGVISSNESLESCYSAYDEYLFANGIIDANSYSSINGFCNTWNSYEKSWEEIRTNSLLPKEKNYDFGPEQTTINGKVLWHDSFGKTHFCAGLKVQLFVNHGISNCLLSEQYANDEGDFSFNILNVKSNQNFFLIAKTESKYASIRPLFTNLISNNDSYSQKTKSLSCLKKGTIYRKNIEFYSEDKIGRAAQIACCLYWGGKYAKAIDGRTPPKAFVKYPSWNGTYENSIYGLAISSFDYCDWDVILHEYGHHLQNWLNITANPGGNHDMGSDYSSVRGKNDSQNLIWGESWPTVFAIMAEKFYKADLKDVRNVTDDYYDDFGDDFDLIKESFSHVIYYHIERIHSTYTNIGESCEINVMGFLYDLYDPNDIDDEPFDNICLGHFGLWNLLKESKAKNFNQFISYIYANNSIDNIDDFNKLLSHYNIAVKNIRRIYSDSGNPIITWDYSGNYYKEHLSYISESSRYESKFVSNEYVLFFYDEKGKFLFNTIPVINNNEYFINDDEWAKIMNGQGESYLVTIESYSTKYSPNTGPYKSFAQRFYKNRFMDNLVYLFPNEINIDIEFNNYPINIENPDFNIIVRGNNALFYDEYNILLGSISNASSIEFECDNWFSKIGFYVSIDSNVSDECLICVEEFKNGSYVRTICWSSLFLSNNINNKTYCEVDFSEPIQKAKISVRKSNFCSEISFFIGNIIFKQK